MWYLILAALSMTAGFALGAVLKPHLHDDSAAVPPRLVYDFELCIGLTDLKSRISEINREGYTLVSVTECEDGYTVFFGRPADG